MSKIKVQNFGPIKEGFKGNDGWMEISKVTVFIGNQGSGKSTIAKLISTMSWLEKTLSRGNIDESEFKNGDRFREYYCEYQNLKNYFRPDSYIHYIGNAFDIKYIDQKVFIKRTDQDYLVPKIMYVPAERNFVSAVSEPSKLKYLPKPLYTFLDEFERSKQEIDISLRLPINNLSYSFNDKTGESLVFGDDHQLLLSEASSGLQSAIPLFLVTRNLAIGINQSTDNSKSRKNLDEMKRLRKQVLEILKNKNLTEELRDSALDILSSLTRSDRFINVVEEPEQNLFPTSQWHILKSLLEFNNLNFGNELIITTHSPYIINYLILAIKAYTVGSKITKSGKYDLRDKLNEIVPEFSQLEPENLIVYELDEKDGTSTKLENYNGLPSDENYLNEKMAENNELFLKMLEIELECQ